jgi:uncharacterized protein (TIGR02186 family)
MRRALLAFLLVLALAGTARAAEPLDVDLSSAVIAITTGFTGAETILFGSAEQPGDVIVVVRGPPAQAVIRRKHRVLGVWTNTAEMRFAAVPAFYQVAASRPLDAILPEAELRQRQIGLANLHPAIIGDDDLGAEREARYRDALLRRQSAAALYDDKLGAVTFLGQHLFRAALRFPADIPFGRYTVETYLVRDGAVVAERDLPLTVAESGVGARVADFAHDQAFGYGLIAVAAAAMAGWVLTLPFRNS